MAPQKYATLSLENRTALVTGASSGIGEATARRLAQEGCGKLVLLARRADRLSALKKELEGEYGVSCVCITCDLASELERVGKLPDELPAEFAHVDILINNAGLALGKPSVEDAPFADVQQVLLTNVNAAITIATAFLRGMRARGCGHVVCVGSIAGHETYAGGSVYCASKHAITAWTAAARHDLVGTPIRMTCVSPGAVETEFSIVRFGDKDKADAVYKDFECLRADDIADQIVYALTRPAHVQIADIVCLATNQSGPTSVVRAGPSLGAPAPPASEKRQKTS
jgi:NADP-dependent 3-hydroxy acid dehydrogenase YdfG